VAAAIEAHSSADDEVADLHEPSGDATTRGITRATCKPRKPAGISFCQERVSALACSRPSICVHANSPPFNVELKLASRDRERSVVK
jgi:hypothetical protein